jgi:hypothetical protein
MTPNPTPISLIKRLFQNVDDMSNENVLDMAPFPLMRQYGDAEIRDCRTYLKINGAPIDEKIHSISFSAFASLFNIATQLKPAAVNDYVTGLRINYGIDSNDKFSVIFQPVCLVANGTQAPNFTIYTPIDGPDFIYKENQFSFSPALNRNVVAGYPQKIQILHMGDPAPSPYVPGDVLSVIFPFQEIYTLMLDNINEASIDLYNSIRKTTTPAGIQIQHAMLLSPNLPAPLFGFSGKYANRANLCPPDCDAKLVRI